MDDFSRRQVLTSLGGIGAGSLGGCLEDDQPTIVVEDDDDEGSTPETDEEPDLQYDGDFPDKLTWETVQPFLDRNYQADKFRAEKQIGWQEFESGKYTTLSVDYDNGDVEGVLKRYQLDQQLPDFISRFWRPQDGNIYLEDENLITNDTEYYVIESDRSNSPEEISFFYEFTDEDNLRQLFTSLESDALFINPVMEDLEHAIGLQPLEFSEERPGDITGVTLIEYDCNDMNESDYLSELREGGIKTIDPSEVYDFEIQAVLSQGPGTLGQIFTDITVGSSDRYVDVSKFIVDSELEEDINVEKPSYAHWAEDSGKMI